MTGLGRLGAGIATLALLVAACTTQPSPTHTRPPLPLPADVLARYALQGPPVEQTYVPVGGRQDVAVHRVRVRAGEEVASFHVVVPKDRPGPHPFVLCLPILAGGEEIMWIAGMELASRGYATAWIKRVASALKPGQDGAALEALFRRTIVHNRIVLAWARGRPELDLTRCGLFGVSLGGMAGCALLACEPDLAGGVLTIAGGDFSGMILASSETRAVSWRRWQHRTAAMSDRALIAALDRELVSDPARLGPYVATERVLLVQGRLDDVVPCRFQDTLWESLGRPRRVLLPVGHFSAALALGWVLGQVDSFCQERFAVAKVGTDEPR